MTEELSQPELFGGSPEFPDETSEHSTDDEGQLLTNHHGGHPQNTDPPTRPNSGPAVTGLPPSMDPSPEPSLQVTARPPDGGAGGGSGSSSSGFPKPGGATQTPTLPPEPTGIAPGQGSGHSGLTTGPLVAAIVVPVVAVIAIALGFFLWWRRRRNRHRSSSSRADMQERTESSMNMLGSHGAPFSPASATGGSALPHPSVGQSGYANITTAPAVRPLAAGQKERRPSRKPVPAGGHPPGEASGERVRGRGSPFDEPPQGNAEKVQDDDAVSEISASDEARMETDRMSAVSDLSYQDEELGERRRDR